MSEKDNLLTAYGNAQFDCGNWREQDEFVPSDAEPEWVPYKTYLEASEAARAALVAHIETLEQERDALAGEVRRAEIAVTTLIELHNMKGKLIYSTSMEDLIERALIAIGDDCGALQEKRS